MKAKLLDRIEVVDISRRVKLNILSGSEARGFKLPVRGLGTVFAVKRGALARWLPGSMPVGRFLSELDDRGWLIRGADGMTTRQVYIPGYGRYRFYCLKLNAAFGEKGGDHEVPQVEKHAVARADTNDLGNDFGSKANVRHVVARIRVAAAKSPGVDQ